MPASTHPDVAARYQLLQEVRLLASVVASGGNITQPSSFVFHVRNPLGSVASYVFGQAGASISNPSPGNFYKDIVPSIAGTWGYSGHASGLVSAREEWLFLVDPSKVLP